MIIYEYFCSLFKLINLNIIVYKNIVEVLLSYKQFKMR